jgi:hypothetical protein
MGISIHTVGCSGLGVGEREFRDLAEATNGTFRHLTYHQEEQQADGIRHSVLYQAGKVYVQKHAPGESEPLSEEDWKRDPLELLREGKVVEDVSAGAAERYMHSPAAASRKNNLDAALYEASSSRITEHTEVEEEH